MVGAEQTTDPIEMPSFEQHRRQRSRSREPSSLRNSLVLEGSAPTALARGQQLGPLKEVASTQNTPAGPITAMKAEDSGMAEPVDLGKRLPTLPNTPSSAYPPSTIFSESIDINALQSHFSSTTIDTSVSEDDIGTPESARFSGWSDAAVSAGHSSYRTESFIEDRPMSTLMGLRIVTPTKEQMQTCAETETDFEDTPQQPPPPRGVIKLATAVSSSTMSTSSTPSMPASPTGSDQEELLETSALTGQLDESPARFQYQHYRLPVDDSSSEITLKSPLAKREAVMEVPRALPFSSQVPTSNSSAAPIAHSITMQELMDELSYLGEAIHQR